MSVLDDENVIEDRTLTAILQPYIDKKFEELRSDVFQWVTGYMQDNELRKNEVLSRLKHLEEEVLHKRLVIENAHPLMIIREENRCEWEQKYMIGSYLCDRVDVPDCERDTTIVDGSYE